MREPETLLFADDGIYPNSRLPVLVYRAAIKGGGAEAFEALFSGNGWPAQWRSRIYTHDHYHSTAHECLGIAEGQGTLRLGGPSGADVIVTAGDVVVLPAGTAHRRVIASADFLVVGAYPPDQQDWDLLRGLSGDRPKADETIARVGLPRTDPVWGESGGLPALWH